MSQIEFVANASGAIGSSCVDHSRPEGHKSQRRAGEVELDGPCRRRPTGAAARRPAREIQPWLKETHPLAPL